MRYGIVIPALLLFPAFAHAVHVGQKVERPETTDAGKPQITYLSADRIDFTTTLNEPVVLMVFDLLGNPVQHLGLLSTTAYPIRGFGSFSLDLDNLRSGMYFITLRNRVGITTAKVAELR